jgi:RNA polymerase sigma-70 factor (ECF subfamily)
MSIGSLSLLRSQSGGKQRTSATLATAVVARPGSTNGLHLSDEDVRPTGSGPQKINMVRPSKEVTDVELLQRFQQGDEEGYVELYLRRQAEVYTYALRLSSGDRDLASDVFQETFIKVYRKAHTFREGTNVLGWLYTIVRTTYLNHKRKRTLVGLDDTHDNIQSTDRSMNPEFREEQSTLKERVERAIASLPVEIREPFILREFDGFSYQEISEQLKITLGAVRQRIYRAKLAMREELQDLVQDDLNATSILAEEDAG